MKNVFLCVNYEGDDKVSFLRGLLKDYADNGKIFSITNVKKDKTLRRYSARLGVKKHLRGGASTTSHLNHLITVYDMQRAAAGKSDDGYRSIDLNTVVHLEISTGDGVAQYVFIDENTECLQLQQVVPTAMVCAEAVLNMFRSL